MSALTAKQHEQRTIIHDLHDGLKRGVTLRQYKLPYLVTAYRVPVLTESRKFKNVLGRDVLTFSSESCILSSGQCLNYEGSHPTVRQEAKILEQQLERQSKKSNEMSSSIVRSKKQVLWNETKCRALAAKDAATITKRENHLKELAEHHQILVKAIKDFKSQYDEAEIETNKLEQKLRALLTEKEEEEEFIHSLHDRLTQLKVRLQRNLRRELLF
ncbi:hypothetical protein R1flu_022011 [Riccia fluitans]|uniref:Uncharacterized protein n=1 Tax=Riccia fluitans TaxID=41844 RepID=A0ABD1ZR74_9MARC